MKRNNLLSGHVFVIAFMVSIIIPLTGNTQSSTDGYIVCEGSYDGHLQGLDTDGERFIFWSFTVKIVKTDMSGKVWVSVSAPSHQGDLAYHDGHVYVAVNLGDFNREPGHADSWVYVYDAGDLSLLEKHEVQEAVHGAGGIAYREGHFFIVGGLPESYEENYVYEYDGDFRFIRRHVIRSGQTRLGIQTACYAYGYFWFGCYGYPDNAALLMADVSLKLTAALDTHASVGIAGLKDFRFFQGHSFKDPAGNYRGKVCIIQYDRSLSGRFARVKVP